MMMFGRELRVPLDNMVGLPPGYDYEQMNESAYAQQLISALQDAHLIVGERLGKHYRYQKKNYDKHVNPTEYRIGDPVWLRVYRKPKGQSRSLVPNWDGPFIVVERVSMVHWKIQRTHRGQQWVKHGDLLKLHIGPLTDAAEVVGKV